MVRARRTREPDSAMLIDATMKQPMPPLALPKREYMEHAKTLWERLGLPPLRPEMPWHGYSLGDWDERFEKQAELRRTGSRFRPRRVLPATAPQGHRAQHADPGHRGNQ